MVLPSRTAAIASALTKLSSSVEATVLFRGPPAGLSDEEKRAFERLDLFFTHGLAYAQEMGNRPQTLYAMADSPVGLAAWIYAMFQDTCGTPGNAEGSFTQDEIELRYQLRLMRDAIDKYKQYSDLTLIPPQIGTEGYPPDLDTLLAEDSTMFGDLFCHVVRWNGELYLEDGLHRALRAALENRHSMHVRILDLDALRRRA